MEMGEAEQDRAQEQRAPRPPAGFDEALENAAEEQFLGYSDEEKCPEHRAQGFSPVGQEIVKVDETGQLAEEKREGKVQRPLANAHHDSGSAGAQRVSRIHWPDDQKTVERYIGKEQLGK